MKGVGEVGGEPEGRGAAWTEERGSLRPSDEGRRRSEAGMGRRAGPQRRAKETLRTMRPADLEGVLGLEHALFGEEAWSRQMLEGELAEQPRSRYYLVAEDDGVLAGYAGLLVAGAQADVLTLAVAADRWGQGTGSALLEALLGEAARRGCTEIFLEVRTDNARAQRLYRRYGFSQIGVRKGYYQPSGTDALVMRRDVGEVAR
jgi:[ribosomal protein S18]-alanine N-acetyltransferase